MGNIVRSRVELKIPYESVPEKRNKDEKVRRSSGTKSNGKIMKPFTLTSMEMSELLDRTDIAVLILKEGVEGFKKTIKAEVAEKFKGQIKTMNTLHEDRVNKLKSDHKKVVEEHVIEVDKLKKVASDVLSQPIKPTKKATKKATTTVGDDEVDSQPIKPTKP